MILRMIIYIYISIGTRREAVKWQDLLPPYNTDRGCLSTGGIALHSLFFFRTRVVYYADV